MKNGIILFGDAGNISRVYGEDVKAALGLERVVTKDELAADTSAFAGTEYLFTTWGMPHFTKDEIKTLLPSLKAVFYSAGSVRGFAREFLECGIKVFSAWAANAVPVAEFVTAEITLANKRFFTSSRMMRSDRSNKRALPFGNACPGNYGSTVGIIGCGMIGSMVAGRLAGKKMRLLAYDPYLDGGKAERLGVEMVPLETLFAESDVVTNHVANIPETVGMLRGEHFASMKRDSVFINTGRGAQIREDEMIAVLSERPDITALLDVTMPEPPEASSKLYDLPNVILTPHIAGSLSGECRRMAEYMLEEYRRLQAGEPVKWEVSLKMLETMA